MVGLDLYPAGLSLKENRDALSFEGTCLLFSCPFLCQAVPVPLGMASLWSHCLLPPTLHNCLQLLQVHFGSSMMTPSQLCVIMTVLFLQGHLYSNRAKYLHIFLYKKENSGKRPGVHWGVLIEWAYTAFFKLHDVRVLTPVKHGWACITLPRHFIELPEK